MTLLCCRPALAPHPRGARRCLTALPSGRACRGWPERPRAVCVCDRSREQGSGGRGGCRDGPQTPGQALSVTGSTPSILRDGALCRQAPVVCTLEAGVLPVSARAGLLLGVPVPQDFRSSGRGNRRPGWSASWPVWLRRHPWGSGGNRAGATALYSCPRPSEPWSEAGPKERASASQGQAFGAELSDEPGLSRRNPHRH